MTIARDRHASVDVAGIHREKPLSPSMYQKKKEPSFSERFMDPGQDHAGMTIKIMPAPDSHPAFGHLLPALRDRFIKSMRALWVYPGERWEKIGMRGASWIPA
jgi:hypothetical protein